MSGAPKALALKQVLNGRGTPQSLGVLYRLTMA